MSFSNPKLDVKDTGNPKIGKGLFAQEKILKGELIWDLLDDVQVLANGAIDALPEKWRGYCFDIDDDRGMCPKDFHNLSPIWFMNHSCDPNIGATTEDFYQSFAMRDIEPREELTYDYAMSDNGDFKFECFCGKPNCRKWIRGTDWMIPELQERYKGYFQKNIQDKINALVVKA